MAQAKGVFCGEYIIPMCGVYHGPAEGCLASQRYCQLVLLKETLVRPLAQILESSQTLLHVLKRESTNLTKQRQTSS